MASKTTTYVARINNAKGFETRASDTARYTHVTVSGEAGNEGVFQWHKTEATAHKVARSNPGVRVVPVETYEGTKATVEKRLTESAPMTTDELADVIEKVQAEAKPAKKAPAKKEAAPKKERPAAAQGTMKTKSGVQHPGALWVKLLEEKELSQTKTAQTMGVAPMTLNRLINGHGIPTAKVTIAFARATDSDVKELWQQVADFELALALEA